jgi:hypothetical protein
VVAARGGTDGVAAVAGALVLAPVAVWAVHGIGNRIAGPRFGLAAAGVYVLLPAAGTAYFNVAYDDVYRDHVLPDLLGLRATPWFASGVAVAVAVRFAPRRAVAAAGAVAAVVGLAVWGIAPLGDVRNGLHETGWSVGLLEWLPLAGILGAARRSPAVAAGLAGWLVLLVLRAAEADYGSGAFWRDLAPALPAAAVVVAALGLLVPTRRPATERTRLDAR